MRTSQGTEMDTIATQLVTRRQLEKQEKVRCRLLDLPNEVLLEIMRLVVPSVVNCRFSQRRSRLDRKNDKQRSREDDRTMLRQYFPSHIEYLLFASRASRALVLESMTRHSLFELPLYAFLKRPLVDYSAIFEFVQSVSLYEGRAFSFRNKNDITYLKSFLVFACNLRRLQIGIWEAKEREIEDEETLMLRNPRFDRYLEVLTTVFDVVREKTVSGRRGYGQRQWAYMYYDSIVFVVKRKQEINLSMVKGKV